MRGQHGPNVKWQDEHSSLLVSLVGICSFVEIARAINKQFGTSYTRNAVIGRAARLGLVSPAPKRSPEEIAATRLARQQRANAKRMQQRREAGIPAAAPRAARRQRQATPMLCEPVEPHGVSIVDVRGCRWPDGDGPFTFCDHPKFGSSSYCSSHFFKSIGRGTVSEQLAHKVSKSKLQGAW